MCHKPYRYILKAMATLLQLVHKRMCFLVAVHMYVLLGGCDIKYLNVCHCLCYGRMQKGNICDCNHVTVTNVITLRLLVITIVR